MGGDKGHRRFETERDSVKAAITSILFKITGTIDYTNGKKYVFKLSSGTKYISEVCLLVKKIKKLLKVKGLQVILDTKNRIIQKAIVIG